MRGQRVSGFYWIVRTECPRGEEQVIIRGPKPGSVSIIIRCGGGWGRHQRHAMRREAAELLTDIPQHWAGAVDCYEPPGEITVSLAWPGGRRPGGTGETPEDAKVFSIAQLTLHTCQLIFGEYRSALRLMKIFHAQSKNTRF